MHHERRNMEIAIECISCSGTGLRKSHRLLNKPSFYVTVCDLCDGQGGYKASYKPFTGRKKYHERVRMIAYTTGKFEAPEMRLLTLEEYEQEFPVFIKQPGFLQKLWSLIAES